MTKKCREIELLLSAYLEHELSREDETLVAEHLGLCPECLDRKEKMERLISSLPGLQEEVPFFLQSKLCRIPEIAGEKGATGFLVFPKWLAAAIGTIILFLNLFYFTNMFPSANRKIHSFASNVEKFAVKTGGWFERVGESKELIIFAFFAKKPGMKGDGNGRVLAANGGDNG